MYKKFLVHHLMRKVKPYMKAYLYKCRLERVGAELQLCEVSLSSQELCQINVLYMYKCPCIALVLVCSNHDTPTGGASHPSPLRCHNGGLKNFIGKYSCSGEHWGPLTFLFVIGQLWWLIYNSVIFTVMF